MRFELNMKSEYYLKVTNDIEEALNIVVNFLSDLEDEIRENHQKSIQLANAIDTITTLYEHCNTNYSINEILDLED